MPELILLIDDEEIIRLTSGEILNELGYEVISAASGDEGVAILKDKADSISMVILDLSMPGKSGIEIYHEIKDLSPATRVLLTSGFREDDTIEEMLKTANDGFIQKPYTIEELNRRLNDIQQK